MKAVADVYRKVFPKGQMLPVAGERPAYAIVEDGKAHIIFVVMKTKSGEEYVEKVFLGGGIEDNFTMLSDELSNIKPEFAHQLAVEHFVFGFLKAVSIRRYLAGLTEPKEREELEAFFTKSLKPKLLDNARMVQKRNSASQSDKENMALLVEGLASRFEAVSTLPEDLQWLMDQIVGPDVGFGPANRNVHQFFAKFLGRALPFEHMKRALGEDMSPVLKAACTVVRRFAYAGKPAAALFSTPSIEASNSKVIITDDGKMKLERGDYTWAIDAVLVEPKDYGKVCEEFTEQIVLPTTELRVLDAVLNDYSGRVADIYFSGLQKYLDEGKRGLLGESNLAFWACDEKLEETDLVSLLKKRFNTPPSNHLDCAQPLQPLQPNELDAFSNYFNGSQRLI